MNNKIILTFALILVLVLSGCAVKQESQTTAPETSKVNKEAAAERAAEPAAENPKLLALLVNKNIIPNIVYEYSRPPLDPKSYIYHIKGDKARIDLPRLDFYPKGSPRLDVVYLDIAAKKATAYCEDKGVCPDRNKAYDVDFATYYYKNPYDWLKEVPSDAEVVGTEQISTRDVTHINYTRSGATTDIWVDQFYNVPLEVQVTAGSTTSRYVYHLISVTGVKDSELGHIQLENY